MRVSSQPLHYWGGRSSPVFCRIYESISGAGNVDRFLYFYAFFRRVAFDPGPLCLNELLRASVEYAHGVGTTLKGQVYDALRHLAQGFLDYPGNELQPTPEVLKETYDHSLILLYRLIFILYAEARELLPVHENELYRDTYSLLATKQAVARGKHLLQTSARLWPQLRELFQAINLGSPPLHVATFNGGLFDPAMGSGHFLVEATEYIARFLVDYGILPDGKTPEEADLLTAQHFGVSVPPDLWTALVDEVMGRALMPLPALQAILTQVEAIAAHERFFHWELEFPELYFDRYGRPLGEDGSDWLITIPCGWTRLTFGDHLTEAEAWQLFAKLYPGTIEDARRLRAHARLHETEGIIRPICHYRAQVVRLRAPVSMGVDALHRQRGVADVCHHSSVSSRQRTAG
jgi:hypothetical protein